MRNLCRTVLAVGLVLLAACTKPPRAAVDTATAASPEARIQRIPAADPEKYRDVRDSKEWKNPYLIVRKDGVALLDVSNNEQRLVKPEDLPEILAQLPLTAWPYGRAVAVGENGVLSSANDAVLIRKNRGIVLGTLESLHILVPFMPPPG